MAVLLTEQMFDALKAAWVPQGAQRNHAADARLLYEARRRLRRALGHDGASIMVDYSGATPEVITPAVIVARITGTEHAGPSEPTYGVSREKFIYVYTEMLLSLLGFANINYGSVEHALVAMDVDQMRIFAKAMGRDDLAWRLLYPDVRFFASAVARELVVEAVRGLNWEAPQLAQHVLESWRADPWWSKGCPRVENLIASFL